MIGPDACACALSTMFLWGPVKQCKQMFEKKRIIATSVYLLSMVLTLVLAFSVRRRAPCARQPAGLSAAALLTRRLGAAQASGARHHLAHHPGESRAMRCARRRGRLGCGRAGGSCDSGRGLPLRASPEFALARGEHRVSICWKLTEAGAVRGHVLLLPDLHSRRTGHAGQVRWLRITRQTPQAHARPPP
jgi:hypothetical protein